MRKRKQTYWVDLDTNHSCTVETEMENRYQGSWSDILLKYCAPALREGITILDVGSGRTPAIHPLDRPLGVTYIGLDVSEEELMSAPPGSYDRVIAKDLTHQVAELTDSIDLVISLHVLEHIFPMESAIRNVHCYLRQDGHFVALFSGRNAHFAWLNRLYHASWGNWP